jgi:hypothetical protein
MSKRKRTAKRMGISTAELDGRVAATRQVIAEAAAQATDVIDEGRALLGAIGFLSEAPQEVRLIAAAQAKRQRLCVTPADWSKPYQDELVTAMAEKLQRMEQTGETPMRGIIHGQLRNNDPLHARHRTFVEKYGWPLEPEHRSFFDSFHREELEKMILEPASFGAPSPVWTAYLGAYNLAQVGALWGLTSRIGPDRSTASAILLQVLPRKMAQQAIAAKVAFSATGPHPRHVFGPKA